MLFFQIQAAKITKGECRDKRKSHFRFDYAAPHPIFVFTKIKKGERRGKQNFRLDIVNILYI